VGWDASSLEARVLAHFLAPYDGGAYRDKFLSGADVHEENRHLFGLLLRDSAKTLWYGIQYGSGNAKAGLIAYNDVLEVLSNVDKLLQGEEETEKILLGVNRAKDKYSCRTLESLSSRLRAELSSWDFVERGTALKATVYKQIPSLKRLMDALGRAIDTKGYISGLDGRKMYVPKDKKYKALNYCIQGAGAVVMKESLRKFYYDLLERDFIPWVDFAWVLNVHDEGQAQVKEECAELFAELAPISIQKAGKHFKFLCPLDGEAKIGRSWAETH
jgi:DNA polymerase I-like protein with 3'-5' exonuclease and polymerase domains